MSVHALGRMLLAPAVVGAAVGALLRPLGPAAVLLGFATLVAAQLAVLARSHRQLEVARRRLEASRARRRRPRLLRRG
jgi:uncharacterized membrane protein YfcA